MNAGTAGPTLEPHPEERVGLGTVILSSNPLYLWRKEPQARNAPCYLRTLAALSGKQCSKSIHQPSNRSCGQSGTLTGNMIAFGHILTGRVDPTYILRLSRQAGESSLPIPIRASSASRGFKEEWVT